MSTSIQKLNELGQSLWYDNIQRRLLVKAEDGTISEMAAMIERGDIRGVTSNPTIFNNAISKTNDYDPVILPLAWSGWNAEDIFWQLAIEDIQDTCDLFSALYQASEGADGYVSLEVNPTLAHNTGGTLALARQLWERVSRPNLMIKIPATQEGLPAIQDAIAAGININITLIFSIDRYRSVTDAYLSGLEARLAAGLPVNQIASVASFFVSRMDTKVDPLLPIDSPLRSKTAIAYTKLAYEEFRKVFGGERFARLRTSGCHLQRPLWASTSTKNPAYPDTLYVNSLIGPDTVDTVPPQTLEAFRDHGKAEPTLTLHLDEARKVIKDVESLGISMEKVTAELEDEGVTTFSDSFVAMLKTIEDRRSTAVRSLRHLAEPVKRRVAGLIANATPARLWSHDPTLWTTDKAGQDEVRNRMGWLHLPNSSRAALKQIGDFVSQVHKEGLNHFLLLGMGGSSLAPEVLSLCFPLSLNDKVYFSILDSTDPDQLLAAEGAFPPEKTLYLVSSKSGGTAEINALFNYFWERSGHTGSHFVAITDPGTSLEALANVHGFRKTFLADPNVGGRYSLLTHFGLVPTALMGIELERLLDRASWMMGQCTAKISGARNPGLVLGAILGQSAADGRDKLTFLADESVAPFGSWLEQLMAESSGKQGKGILPVVGEKVAGNFQGSEKDLEGYGADRLFVYLRREGKLDGVVKSLQDAGQPVLVFNIAGAYDLGAEFYRWEVATAVACSVLGVNAFDQPDVQDAKDRTKAKISEYGHSKHLDQGMPFWNKDGIQAFSTLRLTETSLENILQAFLNSARKVNYVAINAYLPRNSDIIAALEELRIAILLKTGCATTLGFGPRYLHSTGQLHKGGPDSGLFLQITAEPLKDIEIPAQGMSFATLERAQAIGDFEALAARGRRILRLNLPSSGSIRVLADALKEQNKNPVVL
jgi:transaldolase/glucose-6-phosphate isomerase